MEFSDFTILLRWIGYGPGDACPGFWDNREHVMRISLVGDRDDAIAAVRRTWHEHEAEVLFVNER